jgi:hypothetical protein
VSLLLPEAFLNRKERKERQEKIYLVFLIKSFFAFFAFFAVKPRSCVSRPACPAVGRIGGASPRLDKPAVPQGRGGPKVGA